MSDTITVDEKTYVTSKKAATMTSYTQDYIGQLARSGLIEAQRVGGLWYVNIESLQSYKSAPREETPRQTVAQPVAQESDSLIFFDGNDYVSASRGSEISGYNQDYIGQLARSGQILSRRVGNRWYIERSALLRHKSEKDALLAAVQKQSVGIQVQSPIRPNFTDVKEPFFTYKSDSGALFPHIMEKKAPETQKTQPEMTIDESLLPTEEEVAQIPIRVVSRPIIHHPKPEIRALPPKRRQKRGLGVVLAASALTVVIVLSIGLYTAGRHSTYAVAARESFTAAAASGASKIGDILEKVLAPELVYRRSE